MKELSSDILYYKATIGLIVTPIIIALFINLIWTNNFPNTIVNLSYVILIVITVIQWIRWSHTRKVYYDGEKLILKKYFFNKSQSILISSVENLKFVYNFSTNKERKLIKVSFKYQDKLKYIFFFRNSDAVTLNKMLDHISRVPKT